MRTHLQSTAAPIDTIPLLDASALPTDDDWAVLESINAWTRPGADFEADADRLGRFNVSAAYDE